MKYSTTVTQKGQATIPVKIREKLGIKPNTKVTFEIKENEIILKPVADFFTLRGSLKSKKPFDIEAMDKAILKAVAKDYDKKSY